MQVSHLNVRTHIYFAAELQRHFRAADHVCRLHENTTLRNIVDGQPQLTSVESDDYRVRLAFDHVVYLIDDFVPARNVVRVAHVQLLCVRLNEHGRQSLVTVSNLDHVSPT